MKLITWNCQGAFRKKADAILALNPDILIIQECEHPDKLKFSSENIIPKYTHWHSNGGKKGLAVFSFSDYQLELLPEFNPAFSYILPFRVTGNGQSIILFAVWAMPNKEHYAARYIGQVWLAIEYYEKLLGIDTILIGDFNSNKIWDKIKRVGNHTDVVNKLGEKEILSVYHHNFKQEQGGEADPTFFLHRNKLKPYHIDYCFLSGNLLSKVVGVEIGAFEEWKCHSDHLPLAITLKL